MVQFSVIQIQDPVNSICTVICFELLCVWRINASRKITESERNLSLILILHQKYFLILVDSWSWSWSWSWRKLIPSLIMNAWILILILIWLLFIYDPNLEKWTSFVEKIILILILINGWWSWKMNIICWKTFLILILTKDAWLLLNLFLWFLILILKNEHYLLKNFPDSDPDKGCLVIIEFIFVISDPDLEKWTLFVEKLSWFWSWQRMLGYYWIYFCDFWSWSWKMIIILLKNFPDSDPDQWMLGWDWINILSDYWFWFWICKI